MSPNKFTQARNGWTALAVFTVLTFTLLWFTGTFSRNANAAATESKTAGSAEHVDERSAPPGSKDLHDHEAANTDAHGPAAVASSPLGPDIKTIEQKKCEHGIQQIACDECRYELGVVKMDPSVGQALTRTTKVQQVEAINYLQLTGEVQFDQTAVVDVLPVCPGKAVEVRARLGQKVNAGDVLAIVRSHEFGEAKAAYLEAHAAAEIADREQQRQTDISAALEKLLANLAKGPAVPEIANSGPMGEWKPKLITSAARLQQARIAAEREKALLDKQASSQARYDDVQRELQTAQADHTALIEEVHASLNLDGLKTRNAVRLAQAKLATARQRLHLLGLDDKAIQAMEPARDNGHFSDMQILAPRAGTITAQSISEGKSVETTQSLYTIADLSSLWVWCNLYERDLADLHAFLARGTKPHALVRVPAFKDTFSGVVDLIGSTVDETTRTIKVRVQVQNPDTRLKPGMFATVDVEMPASGVVRLVPRQAVLSDEGKTFAFEHWKDDLWLRRYVALGKTRGEMVEILSGLDENATIIASGGFLLKSDVLKAKMGAGCAD